ncbi:MAG: hypothetical protein QM705_13770 [Ancrocorticia sp.]
MVVRRSGSALTWRDAAVVALLMVLSLAWSAVGISRAPELTRYDEWTYIDYAYKVSQGYVPVRGEDLGLVAREAWSCRGMEGTIRHVAPPPCEDVASSAVSEWPYEGENYNGFHPPLYFALAGFGGKAIAAFTGTDFVTAARWISGLCVALGIGAIYLAIRRWRVGRVASFGGALLTLATPAVAASAVIVHNDAMTPLAGAAAVWLAARIFVGRNLGWALPTLAMALIAATRVMSSVGLLAVTVILGVALLVPRFGGLDASSRRPLAGIIAGQVGALVVGYVGWTTWQNARTPADYVPAISGYSTEPYDGQSLGTILWTFIDPYGLTHPVTDWYMQPALDSELIRQWSTVLYVFFLALPLVFFCVCLRNGAGRALAGSMLVGPMVTGLVVQVRELVTAHGFFRVLSGRYAMALVPLYAAGAAWLFDRPVARWVFAGFSGLGYASIILGPLVSGVSIS